MLKAHFDTWCIVASTFLKLRLLLTNEMAPRVSTIPATDDWGRGGEPAIEAFTRDSGDAAGFNGGGGFSAIRQR